jgi:AcrR family transcriptional regulator
MNEDSTILRADAQRNYDRLIKAATAVFSKQGASATLDSISKHAGVGIATLYRNFPTRTALLQAVYADKVAALVSRAATLLPTTSPDKALASWLKMAIEYTTEYGGFNDLMQLMMKDEKSPLAIAGSQLLTKAQEAEILRSDVTILDLLQLVNGIAGDTHAEETERIDKLLSIIMTGLRR